MRFFHALAFLALELLPVDVAANDSPIALSYDAPWECPDRLQFWQQIRMRSARLIGSQPGQVGVVIDARISGSGSLYSGHLRLVESGGAVVERDVGGPNCVDVSTALALITAVTLDAFPAVTQTDLPVTARQRKPNRVFAVGWWRFSAKRGQMNQ